MSVWRGFDAGRSWPRAVPCAMCTPLLDIVSHSFLPFSAVNRERHFSCEDCNGNVSGGFDASVSQVGIFAKLFSFLPILLMFAEDLPHAEDCLADFVWDSKNELVTVLTVRSYPSQGG